MVICGEQTCESGVPISISQSCSTRASGGPLSSAGAGVSSASRAAASAATPAHRRGRLRSGPRNTMHLLERAGWVGGLTSARQPEGFGGEVAGGRGAAADRRLVGGELRLDGQVLVAAGE